MQVLVTFLGLLLTLSVGVSANCASSATSYTPAANPGIPDSDARKALLALPETRLGCSAKVDVVPMSRDANMRLLAGAAPSPSADPNTVSTQNGRSGCRHTDSSLTPLETLVPNLAAGQSVTLTTGQKALLRACSLPAASGVLERITVKDGAELVFDDSPVHLHVKEIKVEAGGSLVVGTQTCPLFSKVEITFYGTKAQSSLTADGPNPTKGILSWGNVDIHGKVYFPTWTRLSRTALAGTSIISLQEAVNWEVGQEIVILTSTYYDCPAKYQDTWCEKKAHENERRTITAVNMDRATRTFLVQVDSPLSFEHASQVEYQVEVVLLSRNIILRGQDNGEQFGGHTQNLGAVSTARYSAIQAVHMGQLNVMARYPFHFHLQGDGANAKASYFRFNSVVDAMFRAYTIHGTHGADVAGNTAYNVHGNAVYIEDGVEENNVIRFNMISHVHPVKRPAAKGTGSSQAGDNDVQSADLLIPSDIAASCFYAPNAQNTFIGNSASGGWSGFAFPNMPLPIGNFKDVPLANQYLAPELRPLKKFYANTAHSTGFYWRSLGSAVYTGAKLWHDDKNNNVLSYISGRFSRKTSDETGTRVPMLFEHTKVFLSNGGWLHWGVLSLIDTLEVYDGIQAVNLFGNAAVDNGIVDARTAHIAGDRRAHYHPQLGRNSPQQLGFKWYDTGTLTILTGMHMKNFQTVGNSYAIAFTDHSDQWLPQGINAVGGFTWTNTDNAATLRIQKCGTPCGDNSIDTMAARLGNQWDWDGSQAGTGKPTIIGSPWKWWNWDSEKCRLNTKLNTYVCDWHEQSTVVYISLIIPGVIDVCDKTVGSGCKGQTAYYTVGTTTHWGRGAQSADYAMPLSPWTGITGMSNTGWHFRFNSNGHNIAGAPSQMTFGPKVQIPRNKFIVFSVTYPATTTFKVRVNYEKLGTTTGDIPMSTYAEVTAATENMNLPADFTCGHWKEPCTNTGGKLGAWHFDGTNFYIRLVDGDLFTKTTGGRYITNEYRGLEKGPILLAKGSQATWVIDATCDGCAVSGTVGGISFYTVDDSPPAQPFAPNFVHNWGPARSWSYTPRAENTKSTGYCKAPTDCVGTWSEWTACSVACGGGKRTRTFTASTQPAFDGAECPTTQTEACNVKACTTAGTPTSPTTPSGPGSGPGSGSGSGPGPSATPTAAPNCEGTWSAWSACDNVSCRQGNQTRTFTPANPTSCTDAPKPETRRCQCACEGSWGKWGTCKLTECLDPSKGGTQEREFSVSAAAANDGADCKFKNGEIQTRACNGTTSRWGPWSECTKACGGGTRSQTLLTFSQSSCGHVTLNSNVTGVANVWREEPCNTQGCEGDVTSDTKVDCQGRLTPWSKCTAWCGGGTRNRTYTVTRQPANGGLACNTTEGTVFTSVCGSRSCPVCGDGVRRGLELCDDGNQIDGDGCSSNCTIESLAVCSANGGNCTRLNSLRRTREIVLVLQRDAAEEGLETYIDNVRAYLIRKLGLTEDDLVIRQARSGSVILNIEVSGSDDNKMEAAVSQLRSEVVDTNSEFRAEFPETSSLSINSQEDTCTSVTCDEGVVCVDGECQNPIEDDGTVLFIPRKTAVIGGSAVAAIASVSTVVVLGLIWYTRRRRHRQHKLIKEARATAAAEASMDMSMTDASTLESGTTQPRPVAVAKPVKKEKPGAANPAPKTGKGIVANNNASSSASGSSSNSSSASSSASSGSSSGSDASSSSGSSASSSEVSSSASSSGIVL